MPLRLGIARWLPAAAAAVAVGVFAWWYLGTGDPESGTPPATTPTATAPPQPEHVAEAVEGLRSEGGGPAEPDAPDRPPWEVVRTVCPWPPLPSSWQVLDEPCLSAMIRLDDNPVGGAPPGWRNALQNDPLGTRRAVAAALARHDCSMVALADDWPGETRPALREACAAGAMVRLAELQDKCVERLHTDWETVHVRSQDRVARTSNSQKDYHQRIERRLKARAGLYWETYMCRTVPPDVFEWIDALPVPPGDPTAHRHNRPPITQALDLYDAARRLGAEIPDWARAQLEFIAEIEKRREQDVPEDGLGGV